MRRFAARRYRRLLALAGAALLWEQLWPRLWPLATIVGAFVALGLLDVLPQLTGWLHAAVLVVFAASALAAAGYALRGLRRPDRASRRRRLERDSGLAHRPLGARDDRLAAGADDPAARSLWALHQKRMAAAAERLTIRPPSPGVPRIEPWGIRAGVVLLLVIGIVAGGGAAPERMWRAVTPALATTATQPLVVEIWMTPPAYTGVAPIFLSNGSGEGKEDAAVAVPQGSSLLAQVSGVRSAPLLVMGDGRHPFAALTDDAAGDAPRTSAYRTETTVGAASGGTIDVRLGSHSLAAWHVRVIPDTPPSAAFVKPPEEAGNGQLAFAYTAADDYGLSALGIEIRPAATPELAPEATPAAASGDALVRLDLPITIGAAGAVSATATEDLSAHRWAGSAVRMRLVARDTTGQTGHSDEIETILPERAFKHPVARAIIALRKRLGAATTANDVRAGVAAGLNAIAEHPEAFANDIVVSLALSVARARLQADAGDNAVDSVRSMLWSAALHLDEGDVPQAERVLAEARAKLADALEAGADDAEIDRLADALEQALAQYLNAVAAELARRGGMTGQPFPPDTVLGSDELRDLVEAMREMARTGSRDGARELLAQLQAMLEGIRDGLDMSANREELAEAGAIMQELRTLADDQQRLLEQTFARSREESSAPVDIRPGARTARKEHAVGAASAAAQDDLRRRLDETAVRLDAFAGEIPPALGEAGAAMSAAARALRADLLGDASDRQGEAVQALRDSLQGAGQAMAQRLGAGLALFAAGGRGGGDPFGRAPGEEGRGFATGNVTIPEQSELRRAAEILDELRRRAGERQRPEEELHYIDRLLRRF
ncbi:MAG: TIGR02302 family protein [Rhodospirillales bacterium]|nr:TIGR02302 family protein [Rhodospirillales bacterium]